MMDPDERRDEDRAVARLLSGRGSLSRPEHESILGAVLEATQADAAPEPSGPRWWWPAGLAALLAVGLALWMVPAEPPARPEPDAFTARGKSEGPQLELRCEPSCRAGGHVMLEVADAEGYDHVAMFSFREDAAVIWYAPGAEDGRSTLLPRSARGLLPFRIELDQTHTSGRYEEVAVFSKRALDRDAIRRAYETRTRDVAIVERTLEVQP